MNVTLTPSFFTFMFCFNHFLEARAQICKTKCWGFFGVSEDRKFFF